MESPAAGPSGSSHLNQDIRVNGQAYHCTSYENLVSLFGGFVGDHSTVLDHNP